VLEAHRPAPVFVSAELGRSGPRKRVTHVRPLRQDGLYPHRYSWLLPGESRTDWIATADLLDEMLRVADVLVISAALTTATEGLIGARELELRKENAILINVARVEIINEAVLYAHIVSHPDFFASIDAGRAQP